MFLALLSQACLSFPGWGGKLPNQKAAFREPPHGLTGRVQDSTVYHSTVDNLQCCVARCVVWCAVTVAGCAHGSMVLLCTIKLCTACWRPGHGIAHGMV